MTQTQTKKVIINNCFGGFRFSEEFENHMHQYPGYEGFDKYSCSREDQFVIEQVEKFGLDKASHSDISELRIVEIPTICSYRIDEYDGWESIETWVEVPEYQLIIGLSEHYLNILKSHKIRDIRIVESLSKADFWDGDESDKSLQ